MRSDTIAFGLWNTVLSRNGGKAIDKVMALLCCTQRSRMEVGKTLYVTNRKQWRSWLLKHHKTASDIWLVYYKKESGKRRIPYNDAVEEALCYGWIDSRTKPRDKESWVQRFTPRRKKSPLSEMNKERVRRLIKAGKMTRSGL